MGYFTAHENIAWCQQRRRFINTTMMMTMTRATEVQTNFVPLQNFSMLVKIIN